MVVNQSNLHGLGVGFSTAFNIGFEGTPTTWAKGATRVPSSTKEQEYSWLGQFPQMREWIGSREIQQLVMHGYTILLSLRLQCRGKISRMITMVLMEAYSPAWAKLQHSIRTLWCGDS